MSDRLENGSRRCFECGSIVFSAWGHTKDCPEHPANDPTHSAHERVVIDRV